jgi:hypothetical protein
MFRKPGPSLSAPLKQWRSMVTRRRLKAYRIYFETNYGKSAPAF